MRKFLILFIFLWSCGNGSGNTVTDIGQNDTTRAGCKTDQDCAHLAASDCEKGVCNASRHCVVQALDKIACDDHNACTKDDTCDRGLCMGKAFTCPEPKGQCKVAGKCDPTKGCIVNDAPDGQSCDDRNQCTLDDACKTGVCTGTAKVCDDGLECTADKCDAGKCVFEAKTGRCLINGKCYKTGDPSPADLCEFCDPDTVQDKWSDRPEGYKPGGDTVCKGGSACVPDCNNRECGDDGCNGTCWKGQGSECNDGLDCTVDACTSGKCTHALATDVCLINGQCVANGQIDKDNKCLACDPGQYAKAWSPRPDGTKLEFGKVCFMGKICDPQANCTGKQCGDNGCGGTCGECGEGTCCKAGQCKSPFLWAIGFGADEEDRALDMVPRPANGGGGVIIGGQFTGSFLGSFHGSYYKARGEAGYIITFDDNGNMMKTEYVDDKDTTTLDYQNIAAMVWAGDELVVTGRVEKEVEIGGEDFLSDSDRMSSFIAGFKINDFDGEFKLQWAHILGTVSGAKIGSNQAMALYRAGNDILMTGWFDTFASYGNTVLTGGNNLVFGFRIKPDGTIVSGGAFGGSGEVDGVLRPDTGNGYWLTGAFKGTFTLGGVVLSAGDSYATLVARVNSGMAVVTAMVVTGTQNFSIASVVSPAGDLFLGGMYSKAFTWEGHEFKGGGDVNTMILAFDSNGTLKWTKDIPNFFGGLFHGHESFGPVLYFGGNNELWVVGSGTNDADLGCGRIGPSGPGVAMVMARLDPATGKCLGQKVVGKTSGIQALVMPSGMVINKGRVYVTGTFEATTGFDSTTLTPQKDSTGTTNWDSFLASYDLSCMEAIK